MAAPPPQTIIFHFLLPVIIFQFLNITTQAANNLTLGSPLYAGEANSSLTSPSGGDFAFGFWPIPFEQGQFLLAIWYERIPEKTVVWYANNGDHPILKGSKLELNSSGQLVLQGPEGSVIWSTNNNSTTKPLQGQLNDTGNFVISEINSDIIVWQSFENPTDTILPYQEFKAGDQLTSPTLTSILSNNKFSRGKFQLELSSDQGLNFYQIDADTGNRYDSYDTNSDVEQLILNESGILVGKNLTSNNTQSLTDEGSLPIRERRTEYYYRATLDFDGTFTQYMRPKPMTQDGNTDTWSVITVFPNNICESFTDPRGGGPCGYNSYCEPRPDKKPNCECPPGFSRLDANNLYGGCKQDDASYNQECGQEHSIMKNTFEFRPIDGVDWPDTDYELRSPSNEDDCRKACLYDCFCAVAIFQDPIFNNGIGNCWKKKLPLSKGRINRSKIDRRALIKVLKANATTSQTNSTLNPGKDDDKNPAILILSILLGTSAIFNFFALVAIASGIYFVFQRRLYHLSKMSDEREWETNSRFYSYKDLEKATNNFKEILGKGAFGTVYKGLIPSGTGSKTHVAIKMLDKVVEEGEKEFTSEVNTISQTHHKNLVRLLGYCDEGSHRLLVYELMHNGSLSNFLFGELKLSWQQRLQIASGIARGLMYLHEECSKQIIHCDIKPQNILLDDSFTAKIADFGLAKLLISNQTQTLTQIRGTKGYVAPEWFRNMPVTVKVDVYSFGVMLLEIICCRRCVKPVMDNEAILTEWAYDCYAQRKVEKLVEKDEEAKGDLKRVEKLVMVAMWCVQELPSVRPSMRKVTMMLEGILEVPTPPCPFMHSSISSSTQLSSNAVSL